MVTPFQGLYEAIFASKPSIQDRRRAKILEGVIEILAKEGVDDLTFERIGKRTHMARSHVVYYFPNREALVEAAMRFCAMAAQQVISQKLSGQKDWKGLLTTYVEANFDWIQKYPDHAAVYLLMYYRSATKKNYRKMHSEIREVGTKRIQAILELSAALPNAKRAGEIARGVQSLITGALVDAMTTTHKNDFGTRRSETVALALEWIEGK